MPFFGAYAHSIDAKNRLSIPAAFRTAMDPERDGDQFYVALGRRNGTLSFFGNRRFDALFQNRHRAWGDDPLNDEYTYLQLICATAAPLEMDKQGRVVLPEQSLKLAGIGRDVMITGVFDHLDLWNRADYEAFITENVPRHTEVLDALTRRARQQDGTDATSPRT